MPDFNSPDREWGGADPRSYESGDGTWFHAALEKDSTGALRLEVWHVAGNGAILSKWTDHGIIGQGGLVLQANGRLDACGYIAQGDNATRRAVPVPGWVRPSVGGGSLSAAQAALLDLLARVVALIRAG